MNYKDFNFSLSFIVNINMSISEQKVEINFPRGFVSNQGNDSVKNLIFNSGFRRN